MTSPNPQQQGFDVSGHLFGARTVFAKRGEVLFLGNIDSRRDRVRGDFTNVSAQNRSNPSPRRVTTGVILPTIRLLQSQSSPGEKFPISKSDKPLVGIDKGTLGIALYTVSQNA